MGTIPIHVRHVEDETINREIASGESIAESLAGLAAVVLAVVGLLGAHPRMFASIATVCAGGALLLERGAIATRLRRLARALGAGDSDIAGGLGAESVVGIAAVVLGVLSLFDVGRGALVLLPVSTILLGAGLLLGSAAMAGVNSFRIAGGPAPSDAVGRIARESVYASVGAHMLVGLGAIVLGILALLGVEPLAMTLVAMLGLGCVVLLSGAAIVGRLLVAPRGGAETGPS